jgi:uncharacterized protein (DUF736 family)
MADDLDGYVFILTAQSIKPASTSKVVSHERNCPGQPNSSTLPVSPFITCVSQTSSNSSSFRIVSRGREVTKSWDQNEMNGAVAAIRIKHLEVKKEHTLFNVLKR